MRLELVVLCGISLLMGCSPSETAELVVVEESLSRTAFTERVENFFEHPPLKAGERNQFLIHLTDLQSGAPVEGAEVTLSARPAGGATVSHAIAAPGKVGGAYLAQLKVPRPGDYHIEFNIKNAALDERMSLTGFKVEEP
jgi:hypothetical protein